ncbi:TetR/AcrR family transcriptional regulator [Actinomadura parmotrematis]|uniref:TetR/AcrR family transcriptional regulator n=1 Tax=Actinomadura parmotrematis TaxID=2864039 RepID=A0ABS7FN00_9ACTN|nr:TetR/AcrR family transcriptional regulator [Actinomadura parmotrematis]MBW8481746.1 TetR/AcrR family transcriptional regulator [Actinomadura parmotrematis]
MDTPPPPSRRPPAGAAVLREDKTEAIRAAVLAELAEAGYGRLSIEAVARRAGVGKAAVYRRWPTKPDLVIDTVSAFAALRLPVPDTGSLRGDVRVLLRGLVRALRHPLAAVIVPDLLAEAARNPAMARTLQDTLLAAQREVTRAVVGQAHARGELPSEDADPLALDLLLGPLYWRMTVVHADPTPTELDRLAAIVVTTLHGHALK